MSERNGKSLEIWERKALTKFARENSLSKTHPVCIALQTDRLTEFARFLLKNRLSVLSRSGWQVPSSPATLEQRLFTLFAE